MLAVLHEVLQSYWHSLKNSVGTLLVVALWIIMFRCALACAVRAAVSAGVRLRVSRPADAPRAGGAGGDSIIGLDFFCGCKFDRHNITGQTNFDTIQVPTTARVPLGLARRCTRLRSRCLRDRPRATDR
jgi:hypothetical protein